MMPPFLINKIVYPEDVIEMPEAMREELRRSLYISIVIPVR